MASPLFSFHPITPRIAQITSQAKQGCRDLSPTIDVDGGVQGVMKAVTQT